MYAVCWASMDKFVQYTYAPDYLRDDRGYMTDPTSVLHDLGIQTVKTELLIDVGNIVKCPDRVIMTEKVFYENKNVPRDRVIAMLEQLFECGIVVLPWDRSEKYGHADGIVRWVGGDTVLLTAYDTSRYFANKFLPDEGCHHSARIQYQGRRAGIAANRGGIPRLSWPHRDGRCLKHNLSWRGTQLHLMEYKTILVGPLKRT